MAWPYLWLPAFALLCLLALSKPRLFSLLTLLGLVWRSTIPLGITLNAEKILYGFMILALVHSGFQRTKWSPDQAGMPFGREGAKVRLLIYYVVVTTVVFLILEPPQSELVQAAYTMWQTPPWRGIVAAILWIAQTLPFFFAARLVRTAEDFAGCVRLFLYAMVATALTGFAQWIGFYVFPPLQQGLAFLSQDAGYGMVTFTSASGFVSYRPSALAGEPREFGFAMAVAALLVLLVSTLDLPGVPRRLKHWSLLILFSTLAVLSASASAVIAFALAGLVLFIWLSRQQRTTSRRPVPMPKYAVLSFVTVILVIFVGSRFGAFERVNWYVSDSLSTESSTGNIVIRLDSQSLTVFGAYVTWLRENPQFALLGAGVGNGAYYAYDYLPASNHYSTFGVSFTRSRIGIIDLISDIGALGTLALSLIWFGWWRQMMNRLKGSIDYHGTATRVALGMIPPLLCLFLVSGNLPLIWFFFGAAFGLSGEMARPVRYVPSAAHPQPVRARPTECSG